MKEFHLNIQTLGILGTLVTLAHFREGSNHSIYTNGKKVVTVKRHKQFDRITAKDLMSKGGTKPMVIGDMEA